MPIPICVIHTIIENFLSDHLLNNDIIDILPAIQAFYWIPLSSSTGVIILQIGGALAPEEFLENARYQ